MRRNQKHPSIKKLKMRSVEGELPISRLLKPDTLYLLPLPKSVKARCESDWDTFEVAYSILSAEQGRQRFERRWGEPPLESYDRIIKLTCRHYIGKDNETYTFYAKQHYGYMKAQTDLLPTARFTFQGDLTLEKLLQVLSEIPSIYDELAELLYKVPERNVYISVYREYEQWYDGTDLSRPVAFQRVIIDNHFDIAPYDIVDYYDIVH
jgi:hypothetical protein